jgi:hypothetical protein
LWFDEFAEQKTTKKQELEMDFRLSTIRALAKRFSYVNERTRIRFLALIELSKRCDEDVTRLRNVDYETVGARFNSSGRSLQRWVSQYMARGAAGLVAQKAPGRRKIPVRGQVRRLIFEYRRRYQWGAKVLQVHLKAWHGIDIGTHRIQSLLRGKHLLRKRRRLKRKTHTRKVVVKIPGEHTQMDVKYFPKRLKNGSKAYVYNFKDHASRWTFKRAFTSIGALETHEFFTELLKHFPLKLWSVQTDNGSEFTNRYLSHIDAPKEHILDRICKAKGIRHRLIPPGEKELQGLVERSHREDEEELYHRIDPVDVAALNSILDEHCHWANSERRRASLGWETANHYLDHYRTHGELYQEDLVILARKMDPWLRPQISSRYA